MLCAILDKPEVAAQHNYNLFWSLLLLGVQLNGQLRRLDFIHKSNARNALACAA